MPRRTLRDRAAHAWFRLRRPATIGVRGVVTNQAGQVLLLRHTYTPGWYFPGGGVERGETCATALCRELLEEAGVSAEPDSLTLISVHANHAFFPNDHVLLFRVGAWAQVPATSRGEIAEIRFVDPLNPPADVSGGTGRRLAELYRAHPVSQHW